MIITLICFGFIVAGFALIVIKSNARINWDTKENLAFTAYILIIFGIISSLVAVAFIIENAITCEVNYQNALHEKEMLEYRIEHMEENITGNEMLYNDIVEFNNNLRNTKKWANNPWTNWFNNQDIATIDYVEIDANQ